MAAGQMLDSFLQNGPADDQIGGCEQNRCKPAGDKTAQYQCYDQKQQADAKTRCQCTDLVSIAGMIVVMATAASTGIVIMRTATLFVMIVAAAAAVFVVFMAGLVTVFTAAVMLMMIMPVVSFVVMSTAAVIEVMACVLVFMLLFTVTLIMVVVCMFVFTAAIVSVRLVFMLTTV